MKDLFEEKMDRLRERVIAETERTGGGGSNMAEPLWFPPGPVRIPDGLPPEELARRKKNSAEIDEYIARLRKAEQEARKK
ncbi:MAG: hypothetical protein IJT50_03005 [Lentisphaeria bacterium]|nr:hypothetical protein [Lentisphaeria bacterium]